MVNKNFRNFSGKAAILSLNGSALLCFYDGTRFSQPATYIVRDGLVYSYKATFQNGGILYVTYILTDLSFSKLVLFVEKSIRPTLVEFCYD